MEPALSRAAEAQVHQTILCPRLNSSNGTREEVRTHAIERDIKRFPLLIREHVRPVALRTRSALRQFPARQRYSETGTQFRIQFFDCTFGYLARLYILDARRFQEVRP
jgi:hypothetical protein